MSQLLENYGAVLIAVPVGIFLVLTALLATKLLAPRRPTRLKGQVYECGMLPIGRNWAQIHVRYYIFALLFLVFDVEIIFLFPGRSRWWAWKATRRSSCSGSWSSLLLCWSPD